MPNHDNQTLPAPAPGLTTGLKYRNGTSDLSVIHQVFTRKDYDIARLARGADILGRYRTILNQGQVPLTVDAGANIGASTAYFARMYPQSKIIAIEPEGSNFQLLAENTKPYRNVECVRAALSGTDGTLGVVDAGNGHWGYRTAPLEPPRPDGPVFREQVPAISVGRLIGTLDQKFSPFLMKIDIEGGEKDLFSGDTGWVDRFELIVIELHDWMLPGQGTSAGFLKCVANLDRDFVCIGENVFSIRNA